MKVFYAVLDMGLGHATRSLPVIRGLVDRGCGVVVGSAGGALRLLREECPDLETVELPAYRIRYGRRGADLPGLVLQGPGMLRTIRAEHQALTELAERHGVERVVSDHRYGCWHPELPSFFLTHQIRFIAPRLLRPVEGLGALFNRRYHRRYRRVLVPDRLEEGQGLLSGRLSRPAWGNGGAHAEFVGPLSSLPAGGADGGEEEIDIFVSISGPEPQRTVLEHRVLQQLPSLPGRREAALGLPGEAGRVEHREGLVVHAYLDRAAMADRMRRARVVVCRSGYSTLMELAAVGGKALLVPTPGQTEQLYLAERMDRRGWAPTVRQEELDLTRDIPLAREAEGIPVLCDPAASARRACDVILEG